MLHLSQSSLLPTVKQFALIAWTSCQQVVLVSCLTCICAQKLKGLSCHACIFWDTIELVSKDFYLDKEAAIVSLEKRTYKQKANGISRACHPFLLIGRCQQTTLINLRKTRKSTTRRRSRRTRTTSTFRSTLLTPTLVTGDVLCHHHALLSRFRPRLCNLFKHCPTASAAVSAMLKPKSAPWPNTAREGRAHPLSEAALGLWGEHPLPWEGAWGP
jgi:hypothetical protein